MSWRTLLITQKAYLCLRNQQLRIEQELETFHVPIEDIAVIVIENNCVTLSVALLSALAKNNVTLLTCDENFLPCGQWLAFQQYHRPLKILKLQIEATAPTKKRIWQQIVQSKIKNQAQVLVYAEQVDKAKYLFAMANQVKSGDKENIEARAAAIYFKSLFFREFTRKLDHVINAYLNYGYSILRSAVARSLVSYGYHPSLGLNHSNELNGFNLADDMIEPFRPLVDLYVWSLCVKEKIDEELTVVAKQRLIQLLHYQLSWDNKTTSVLNAIDKTISHLQQAYISKTQAKLTLPEILYLKEHSYE
ncbi:type II CRISPR-associated endonuclease Cas1 [Brackiella oedipodis]|uniref:type II CRISPR-associated endonuclease Cas1 n=1 Tax=Brackiella oedipodis TaxID=124225 RepID=UPI00048C0A51|nr:type II CRISPR-associated endonuclease Cas1 [Brackiella oedipodis]